PTADSHIIFFCFEAEDGIRDFHVTGVQTCALPISGSPRRPAPLAAGPVPPVLGSAARRFRSRCVIVRYGRPLKVRQSLMTDIHRSEERRVGKEWRSGGWPAWEDGEERSCDDGSRDG